MINFDKIIRVIRVKILNKPGTFGKVADAVGENGGNMGDIKVIRIGQKYITRDITIYSKSPAQFEIIVEKMNELENVKIIKVFDEICRAHEGGLLEIKSKVRIESISDFEKFYLPGIAKVANTIQKNPDKAFDYTAKGNTVGVISNGSALLNFKDVREESVYAVMESLSAVINELIGVSAIPIILSTKNKKEFIETVKNIYKSFGMIILEDIESPASIKIEESLQDLDIPVIDTNKTGNAVATLAGLVNISKKIGINLKKTTIGFLGYGTKAYGINEIMQAYGVKKVLGYDIKEDSIKRMKKTKVKAMESISELMEKADIVIGTSRIGGLIKFGMVRKEHVLLSLSKPIPEIDPEIALKAGARYAGSGKLISPLLVVPGIIKGTLEARSKEVTLNMKIEAALKLAELAKSGEILPNIFDKDLHVEIAKVVRQSAIDDGVSNLVEFELEEDNSQEAEEIFDKIKELNGCITC